MSLIVLLCTFTIQAQAKKTTEWQLAKEKENVKIFTRKVEGYQIKETKIITTVDVPIEDLYQVLTDFENQKEWMVNFSKSDLIETRDSAEYIYYIEIDAPWPIMNRDLVLKGYLEQKSDSLIVFRNEKTEGYVEEQKGCIRVPMMHDQWRFLKEDENTTQITHIAHGDPGGMIPSWIINIKMVSDPIKSMNNFVQAARKMNISQ